MTAPKTEFGSLPRELRDIIWEYALPPPRLFTLDSLCRVQFDHLNDTVQRAYKLWFHNQQVREPQRVEPTDTTHCFRFRKRHAPPVVTQICRESRHFALDAGFFLIPSWGGSNDDASGRGPGAAWFNGKADVLVIEGSNGPLFLTAAPIRIPNAARVRRVGYIQDSEEMLGRVWTTRGSRVFLRRRLTSMYAFTPGLTTLLHVRPGVRFQESLERKRDEAGPGLLEPRLVPLSLSSQICVPPGRYITWGEVLGTLMAVLEKAGETWEEALRWER